MPRQRMFYSVAAVVIVFIVLLFALPQSPYSPKPSTGVFLTGCAKDGNGNLIPSSCSYGQKALAGQSVVSGFGGPIGSVFIPSAFVKLNYSGTASSWSFSGAQVVQYDKGVSTMTPFTQSGSGSPTKMFNLTLPQSSWTVAQLQAKWSGYGPKVVNSTIVGCSLTLTFGPAKAIKPCAYNYFVSWSLTFGPSATTTTSNTTSSSVTQTTTTTSSTTTTTVNGGSVTTGSTNVWNKAVNSVTNGISGNQAGSGLIVTVAQDYTAPGSQVVVWIYLPSAGGAGYSVGVTTNSRSVGIGPLSLQGGGKWNGPVGIVVSTNVGDVVIVTLFQGSATLFNQAVAVAATQPPAQCVNNAAGQLIPGAPNPNFPGGVNPQNAALCGMVNFPPPPYTTQYITYYQNQLALIQAQQLQAQQAANVAACGGTANASNPGFQNCVNGGDTCYLLATGRAFYACEVGMSVVGVQL